MRENKKTQSIFLKAQVVSPLKVLRKKGVVLDEKEEMRKGRNNLRKSE
jgi:hypothetical protein